MDATFFSLIVTAFCFKRWACSEKATKLPKCFVIGGAGVGGELKIYFSGFLSHFYLMSFYGEVDFLSHNLFLNVHVLLPL